MKARNSLLQQSGRDIIRRTPSRRAFVALMARAIAGTAAAWPVTTHGQQTTRRPVVAMVYSIGTVAEMSGTDPLGINMRAFERGLRDLGWIDGRTVTIERHSTEGDPKRAAVILAEIVPQRPDVILLGGARWLHEAAARATRTIPLVAPFGEDPVADGLIASLARPGGNLTGVTRTPGPEFYGKAIEFLREVAPRTKRLAFLAPREALSAFEAIAKPADTIVIPIPVDTTDQLDAGFGSIVQHKADALLVPSGPVFLQNARRIAAFATEHGLPGLFGMRQSVEAGGLMSYGPSIVVLYRQMARQVDRILRGARPEDIPTERPTTFELVINARTAARLGLAIPPTLQVLADEVIE
jgi:putative ABC transport system substrate-binding protein